MQQSSDVVFLDFSGHDFDQEVKMKPKTPDRVFGRTHIVWPSTIFLNS